MWALKKKEIEAFIGNCTGVSFPKHGELESHWAEMIHADNLGKTARLKLDNKGRFLKCLIERQ